MEKALGLASWQVQEALQGSYRGDRQVAIALGCTASSGVRGHQPLLAHIAADLEAEAAALFEGSIVL